MSNILWIANYCTDISLLYHRVDQVMFAMIIASWQSFQHQSGLRFTHNTLPLFILHFQKIHWSSMGCISFSSYIVSNSSLVWSFLVFLLGFHKSFLVYFSVPVCTVFCTMIWNFLAYLSDSCQYSILFAGCVLFVSYSRFLAHIFFSSNMFMVMVNSSLLFSVNSLIFIQLLSVFVAFYILYCRFSV